MQFFYCMFCGEEVQVEQLPEAGDKISCPACYQQYEVVSANPFRVQPENRAYDEVWENPEKQARVRRMEHRSKLDYDVDEEGVDEGKYQNGRFAGRSTGKRSKPPKRIRGYVYDRDDD